MFTGCPQFDWKLNKWNYGLFSRFGDSINWINLVLMFNQRLIEDVKRAFGSDIHLKIFKNTWNTKILEKYS